MSDDYSADCERKEPTEMVVRQYTGDEPGTRNGITRQAGIMATGRANERESGLATFRGRETLRKANNR